MKCIILYKNHLPVSLITLFFVFAMPEVIRADDFYLEMMTIGGYSDLDGVIGGNGMEKKNSVGFEYYKKFSDEYGDYMTLNVQARFAYDTEQSGDDAFGVEFHNAWLDIKTGLGKAIRVGHFSPAFGLEPGLDTHSTLVQTLAMKNIGFKKDWGVGYRSMVGDFDCQVAAQLGSGMGIASEDGNHLLSGRISTPSGRDTEFGVSCLYGKTLRSMETWTIPKPDLMSRDSTRKYRFGADYQCPLWLFDFKAECAFGEDEDVSVGGGLVRLEYTLPESQNTKLKLQAMYWSHDLDNDDKHDLSLLPVVEHKLADELTFRVGYFHDLYSANEEDKMIVMQLYYFGL